jgi:polyisoprenyl-phosphate glycosyltransferase
MMDGDLQDPPELIPEMFKKLIDDDFDVVYGKRTDRKESFLKKAQIKLFHYIFKKVNNINAPANVGNFSIMTRGALDAFLRLKEKNRYLPGLRFFIGFKQGFVEYSRPDRKDGEAKMSNIKLIKLAFDAIFSFSKLPIKLALIIGILGILISIVGAGIVFYKYIIGVAITGWTSTMLALFFFGSIQLFFLGILGEYVFRIYTETKDRPVYIIKNKYNL